MDYVQRARDVRLLVKQEGVEKGLIKAVERLCEDNEMMRQEMQALTKVTNKMADIVAEMVAAATGLKDEMDKIFNAFYPNKEMKQ